jgi:SOS-response transcriptional repressor LexA
VTDIGSAVGNVFLAEGDYVLRYRGKNLPLRGVLDGDYLVVKTQTNAEAGQLVVTEDPEGNHSLLGYEDGLRVRGLVTGVMRRLHA